MMIGIRISGAAVLSVLFVFATNAGAAPTRCPNANVIGVARTVEIDTTGGPGFGFEHYKAHDFLQQKEVVLTFDDGPQKFSTEGVLAALAEHCTKATFFTIGKMALGYPEIIREVAKAGHTIGTHTWSHQAVRKLKTFDEAKDEIERGVSAVKRAVGGPIAPFFRFPTLQDSPETIKHLGARNIAMFSTDVDSFDFKLQSSEKLVQGVMQKLEKSGKGIILMHDIHKTTAKALPLLLTELKAKGYKVVHLRSKAPVETLAQYDAAIEKDAKGLPAAGTERPTSSIVKTVEGDVPPSEAEAPPAAVAAPPAKSAEAEPPAAPAESGPGSALQTTAAAPIQAESSGADAPPATTASISNDSVVAEKDSAAPKASGMAQLSNWAKDIWQSWFGN